MLADQASAIPPSHNCALVTPGAWQPALRTGFAALGLAALLDLPRADRAERVMALGGAAAAGWYLMRGCRPVPVISAYFVTLDVTKYARIAVRAGRRG